MQSTLAQLCFAFILFINVNTYAQNENIRLLYHQNWEDKHKKKPKDQKKWQEFELFARMYGKYAIPEEKTLPLVFNFIDIDNSNKVDEALIIEQIDVINSAFAGEFENKTGRDYSGVIAGDTKLRFCLGDPNGNIKGINYKEKTGSYTLSQFEQIFDKKDGIEGAKKDEYINVWITELPDQMGGLAIMPDQDSLTDGIYIDPDYFGVRPESEYYREGKTIVHLLGQYLGLKPLWNLQDCFDDGVDDTPMHNGPNYKCYEYSHITLCAGNGEEMIGNFMDANPDECAFMFTKGQSARMNAALTDNGYRNKILDGKKLCEENIKNEIIAENRTMVTKLDFTLVPNPANTIVEVIFENPNKELAIQVEIINLLGIKKNVITIPSFGENKGRIAIDISNLIAGQYVVKILSGNLELSKSLLKI